MQVYNEHLIGIGSSCLGWSRGVNHVFSSHSSTNPAHVCYSKDLLEASPMQMFIAFKFKKKNCVSALPFFQQAWLFGNQELLSAR